MTIHEKTTPNRKRSFGGKLLIFGSSLIALVGVPHATYAFDCPDRVLSLEEVREFVEAARKADRDLIASGEVPDSWYDPIPQAPEKSASKMLREGCIYYYKELELPLKDNAYMLFLVDSYGDVIAVLPPE